VADSDLEKTESASPRRLEQAREDGQVARSRELSTFALLAVGFGGVYLLGGSLFAQFTTMFRQAFTFGHAASIDPSQMMGRASQEGMLAAMAIAPILLAVCVAALVSPLALGGWLLTTKPLMPNFGRLDPMKGIGKLFSMQSLAQLGMGIAKCVLVGCVATAVALHYKLQVVGLLSEPVRVALPHAAQMVGVVCASTVGAMLLLVAADVPYQLYAHAKKLRMTKEEVKREYKENEGDPHVKGKIREQQRAMARRRMMAQVATADVIITNPTHFAVALRYADNEMRAPRVVAKGADLVAARIREIAAENRVPILEAPPLARTLYRHVDLNREIPGPLYGAVAEVLAWVFQLRRFKEHGGERPVAPRDVKVPADLAVSADELADGVAGGVANSADDDVSDVVDVKDVAPTDMGKKSAGANNNASNSGASGPDASGETGEAASGTDKS